MCVWVHTRARCLAHASFLCWICSLFSNICLFFGFFFVPNDKGESFLASASDSKLTRLPGSPQLTLLLYELPWERERESEREREREREWVSESERVRERERASERESERERECERGIRSGTLSTSDVSYYAMLWYAWMCMLNCIIWLNVHAWLD